MAPMRKPTNKTPDEFGEAYANAVSLAKAARQLGITQRELRRRLGRGEIPFVETRGRLKIPQAALERAQTGTESRSTQRSGQHSAQASTDARPPQSRG